MTPSRYRLQFGRAAFEFWKRQSPDEQVRLSDKFAWLAVHPHYEGDWSDVDAEGMRVFQSVCGPFLISHRTDHAVCEVRIQDVVAEW